MSGIQYTITRFNQEDCPDVFQLPAMYLEPGKGIIWTTDGCLLDVCNCSFDKFDAMREMYAALSEGVELYGKPGGPWNVPGDRGSWLDKARKALTKAKGQQKDKKEMKKPY